MIRFYIYTYVFSNACEVIDTIEAPYYANNTRNETLALLNLYPFEQYVHMERCRAEGDEMLCRAGCRYASIAIINSELILHLSGVLRKCTDYISFFHDLFCLDVSSSTGYTDYWLLIQRMNAEEFSQIGSGSPHTAYVNVTILQDS